MRGAEAMARDLGRVAAVHARYADITVLTRPTEENIGDGRAEIIEGVLFYSGRPVLIALQIMNTPKSAAVTNSEVRLVM